MNTCYLVYRINPKASAHHFRELMSIFSTEKKAQEFIDDWEKIPKTTVVYYEYEEWGIE